MHRSLLIAFAATILLFSAARADATEPTRARPLPAPARDCLADGRLDHDYAKVAVRRAITRLAAPGAHHATCRQRLRRVLRHGGDGRLRGRGSVRAATRDCVDNGWLDRRWTIALLRTTLRRLPTDAADYSDCPRTIRAELRARRART